MKKDCTQKAQSRPAKLLSVDKGKSSQAIKSFNATVKTQSNWV
jgi:hypothetical protein